MGLRVALKLLKLPCYYIGTQKLDFFCMPLKAVYWVSQATGLRLGKILSTSRTFNLFCWLHDVVVFYP